MARIAEEGRQKTGGRRQKAGGRKDFPFVIGHFPLGSGLFDQSLGVLVVCLSLRDGRANVAAEDVWQNVRVTKQ
jgi:hypothetical protein